MSPSDIDQPLDMRDVLARIDRAQAETRKFVAEHDDKLAAEARKFERERTTTLIAALGGVVAALAAIATLLHSYGKI